MDKGWILEIGFLILVLENGMSEAVLRGWWSNHKSNHCQEDLYIPEPLRVSIPLEPMSTLTE